MEKVEEIEEINQNTKERKIGKLERIQIIAVIFSLIIGTLLHFLFEWTGENAFIASFSAVNESVWEHLKLVFFPMLIAAIIEYFYTKNITNNYIEAKTIGIFSSIAFIVIFFFTYTGILGTNFLFIDILTFIFSILLGEWAAYKLMKRESESTKTTKILSVIIIMMLFFSFVICTYIPPEVNLFKDPTSNKTFPDINHFQ